MISVDTARKILLALPEAEEGEHMNHPDFRVRKKIFATLWPDEHQAVVFVPQEEHAALIEQAPKAFSLNGWSKNYGALNVHLKHLRRDRFKELAIIPWKRKAPAKLVEVFDLDA